MKRFASPLILLLLAVTVGGCASTVLPDSRILSNTAGVLGAPENSLTISDRRTELTNTYYVVKTQKGVEYACVINGGNVLTIGMVNPPVCNKKG